MRKFSYVSAFALLVLLVQMVMSVSADRSGCMAIVTHKEEGVPDKVLYLPLPALDGHLGHGDTLEGYAGECSTQEPTATPTQEPTATPTQEPTATPTQKPTATPTQEPTVETVSTVSVTSVPVIVPTETPTPAPTDIPVDCEVGEVCDPCTLLMQALDEGMVVVISGPGDVQIILDEPVPQVQVSGSTLATGNLYTTR